MFEKIKRWSHLGLWTNTQVQNAVDKGILTPEQYDEITAEN